MKKRVAAIAAIAVVGSIVLGAPAFAEEGTGGSPSDAGSTVRVSAPFTETIVPAPHPLELPSGAGAGAGAARQQSPNGTLAASRTGSISGTVLSAGRPAVGIEATAVLYDKNGDVASLSEGTTDSAGHYTITALATATYWLAFHDPASGSESVQWWDSTLVNPYGTSIAVADGQGIAADWALSPTGIVTGTVTCEQCTKAPDPATTEVAIYVRDPADPNNYIYVANMSPDSDGSYISYALYPNDNTYTDYMTFVFDTGSTGHSPTSYSDPYTISPNQTVTANVIISHLIDVVFPDEDGYAMADNSVVNALYWDFLGRLPSVDEARGWVLQLYNGTETDAVANGFVTSDEYRLIRIDAAYQGILGRAADGPGRAGWLANMKAGRITTDDIETQFYASAEYFSKHGATNTTFVASLYQTLLHRTGTASEYAGWVGQIDAHGRQWVVDQFWDAQETISERVILMYEKYLGRTPDAAGLQNWVKVALQIGDSGLRAGLSGSGEYFVRSQYRYSER